MLSSWTYKLPSLFEIFTGITLSSCPGYWLSHAQIVREPKAVMYRASIICYINGVTIITEGDMRWGICFLVLLLTACASHPQDVRQQAFAKYWTCARSAIDPYIHDDRLSAREVAMRAQAHCYSRYEGYRMAQGAYVRSVVTPGDYQMATQLADQSALQQKRKTTSRLTDLVVQIRAQD